MCVFRRVSRRHRAALVRSMDSPNLIYTLQTIALVLVDSHCESESQRELQTLEFEWHICRDHCCLDNIIHNFRDWESGSVAKS